MGALVHDDLKGIMMSKLITYFVRGLVAVFVPLILLYSGVPLWGVCAFYVGYAVFKIAVNYPCMMLINRSGVRLGLIIGTSASAGFMLILSAYSMTKAPWLLAAAALSMALQNSFTWNSEHMTISNAMKPDRKGRDLATIEGLRRIVSVAAPVIGGFIAALVGQFWLTALAAVVQMAAIVPIWKINRLEIPKAQKIHYTLRSAPLRDLAANYGNNSHRLVGLMVWPIYLAVFVPSFRNIGIVTTVATLISVIVLQFAGKRGDKGKGFRVLIEGTAASSVVHVARILASSNPIVITAISALYDIALGYHLNPWLSHYYIHARKQGINYVMSMEIAGDLAYLLLWGLLGVVAFATGDAAFFNIAFGAGALLVWLCVFIRKEPKSA